jgi:hypothetical protein
VPETFGAAGVAGAGGGSDSAAIFVLHPARKKNPRFFSLAFSPRAFPCSGQVKIVFMTDRHLWGGVKKRAIPAGQKNIRNYFAAFAENAVGIPRRSTPLRSRAKPPRA